MNSKPFAARTQLTRKVKRTYKDGMLTVPAAVLVLWRAQRLRASEVVSATTFTLAFAARREARRA